MKTDAQKEIDELVKKIREWFDNNGKTATAVIGISGGKDSTVCAKLLTAALGKDRVYGVLMPNGEQADIEDSLKLVKLLDIRYSVVNIHDAVEALKKEITASSTELSDDANINLPPRIRMSTLYAIAQSMPGGGRVINTCNRSEDYIGYSTKYGDAAGDVSILGNYTVTEVRKIGDALGLPHYLVHKAPSDGLCGLTDEDKLGFTYDTLDKYIETGLCENEETKNKIDRLHRMNLHKLKPIPAL